MSYAGELGRVRDTGLMLHHRQDLPGGDISQRLDNAGGPFNPHCVGAGGIAQAEMGNQGNYVPAAPSVDLAQLPERLPANGSMDAYLGPDGRAVRGHADQLYPQPGVRVAIVMVQEVGSGTVIVIVEARHK